MTAVQLLERAIELDQNSRKNEALDLYIGGIQKLIETSKGIWKFYSNHNQITN